MRLREGVLVLVGADPHHEVRLGVTAAHGAAHHETQAAEHLLLDDVVASGEARPDALSLHWSARGATPPSRGATLSMS